MKSVIAVGHVALVLCLAGCGGSGTPIGAAKPLSGNNSPDAGTPGPRSYVNFTAA
jgi:hypothetical protein